MFKYKMYQKGNPIKKQANKKWYATPMSDKPLGVKALTRAATQYTTIAPIEMEASVEFFTEHIMKQLLEGHTVNLPGFGSFRITFKSEGVEEIGQFNAGQMIKNPRMIFTPAKEVRQLIHKEIRFENGGVLADGITYSSLADYRKAKEEQQMQK